MSRMLTLASGSAARRRMLAAAGLTFEVRPARIPEPLLDGCPAAELPVVLAQAKAAAALEQNPGRVVVAADGGADAGWKRGPQRRRTATRQHAS